MRTVKIRHGVVYPGDGTCTHDETPSTYEEAERIAGVKLDRRKNYMVVEGKVCEAATWTDRCGNCDGGGCPECGGKGKRRYGMWIPVGLMGKGEIVI
jgi:hypothetical protein